MNDTQHEMMGVATGLRAIPTQYGGVTFRSRLEARWAALFDGLALDWRYEHQGFDLGDGLRWLPDFWLPQVGWHVEIKPTRPELDSRAVAQIDAFNVMHGYGTLVLGYKDDQWSSGDPAAVIFYGEPIPDKHGMVSSGMSGDGGGVSYYDAACFARDRKCTPGDIWIVVNGVGGTSITRGRCTSEKCWEYDPACAYDAYEKAQLQWSVRPS